MGFEKPSKETPETQGLTRRGFLAGLALGSLVPHARKDTIYEPPATPRKETREDIAIVARIRSYIEKHGEDYTVRRELKAAGETYLLELEIEGEKPGETIEYSYQRKGSFPKADGSYHAALATRIDVTVFEDGMPVAGKSVALFNEEKQEWQLA